MVPPRRSPASSTPAPAPLPPGQRARPDFPRFGTHLHLPAPPVPDAPAIEVAGAVAAPFSIPLERLGGLPRREQVSDFHCVGGWSTRELSWAGVPFGRFFEELVVPALAEGVTPSHLVLEGLDGYRAVEQLEDALGDDVLLADRLDGQPLASDHGAPIRFLSPGQYGYVSVKHLCRIEVWTRDPGENFGHVHWLGRLMLPPLFWRHPRGRVRLEERNRRLPNWLLRPIYAVARVLIRRLSARGSSDRAR